MMLEARNVTVAVGRQRLLDRVSVTLAPGELVVVLGPNGAGKSTLLGCLAGARTPIAGRVTLDGRPLARLEPRELARRRAVLAQNTVVTLPVHAEEVVALGRVPHADAATATRRVVAAALDTADASAFIARSVATLSGGEQQRVHLARALAQIWPDDGTAARYLLLDEPTASLDLAHQAQVMATARALADAGHGVLAILHDLNLAAAVADRLVLLDGGRLAAAGPPAAVLVEDTIARVFGLAADVVARPDGRGPLVVPHALGPRPLSERGSRP
ncbi:MAG: heme ABC transporter ATP-binding protein [Alphaproteobacteria bacterium]|nr:heme ABC transporter ATP-binding protein [Alphaproteobacteria bacterium]